MDRAYIKISAQGSILHFNNNGMQDQMPIIFFDVQNRIRFLQVCFDASFSNVVGYIDL